MNLLSIKESFLVVPLLALKMKKDLSEIAGWLGPTKKGMGVFGWADLSKDWLPSKKTDALRL